MPSLIYHQLWTAMIALALVTLSSWAMAQETGAGPGNATAPLEGAALIEKLQQDMAALEAAKEGAIAEFDVVIINKRELVKKESEEEKKILKAKRDIERVEFNKKGKTLLSIHDHSIKKGKIICKNSNCTTAFSNLNKKIKKYNATYKKKVKELDKLITPPAITKEVKAAELKSMKEYFDSLIDSLKQKIAYERTRLAYAKGKGNVAKALKSVACVAERCSNNAQSDDDQYACVRCCWEAGCTSEILAARHVRKRKSLTAEQVIQRYKATGSAQPGRQTFKPKDVPLPAPGRQ